MPETVLAQRANALLALHKPGDPVVLPTVWDAWSAALAVDAGFAALTVGSHPVADSIGKPDGEGMSFDDLLARVASIGRAVDSSCKLATFSGGAATMLPSRCEAGAGCVRVNVAMPYPLLVECLDRMFNALHADGLL